MKNISKKEKKRLKKKVLGRGVQVFLAGWVFFVPILYGRFHHEQESKSVFFFMKNSGTGLREITVAMQH